MSNILSGLLLAGGVALTAMSDAKAQGFVIETGVEALSSPNTLIHGLHRLYIGRAVSPRFSFGQGIYSAALGDAGGAFFWGFEGVARIPLTDRFSLSFSGFLGGGGGAAQVNGDGTMVRASAALDYRVSRAWDAQITASWVRIAGAPIDGPAFGVGLRYRLDGEGPSDGGTGALDFAALSMHVTHMVAPSSTRSRNGGAQPAVSLVGVRAHRDLNARTRLVFSAAGAARGAQGYMQIMAEARRIFPMRRLSFFVEGGAGFGGGGNVDTGSGLLLSAAAGVTVPVTRRFNAELSLGALTAATGGFRAATVSLNMVRAFGRQREGAGTNGERWAFSAGFSAQQVGANYFAVPGNPASLVIMQESSLDYFVGQRLYLTGAAQTTMAGGVAGYAIGSVGAGYEIPVSDRWSLSLEGFIGAAGGGGVNTAGGIIGGVRAELDYHVTDTWRLSMALGQMTTLRGNGMSPATLTVGVKIPFTTHR